ncbi:MAG: hypothetical protein AABX02_00960 [archaeon]|mgnify:CR=1 FL=1
MAKGKDDFLRVYANLPIDVRKEIIVVIDNQPITWNVAFEEINNDTKLGSHILKKVIELEFI